jgi:segregation and condensation protein B
MGATVRLIDQIQALLFVADSPATIEEVAQALDRPIYEVEEALESLGGKLTNEGPLQVVRIAGGYQLCTKPDYAEAVARFLKPQAQKLTRSVMEVLAIVAYKQPVTLPEIDAVRGVQSDYGLGQLIEKRLVAEVGRKNAPGRPVLYGTTQQFLHLFNLDKLEDLPDLKLEVDALGKDAPPEQPALIETT